MPKDPKLADEIAKGPGENTPPLVKGWKFLRDNLTFALTLIYIDLTVIGFSYAFLFYRQLGVQIVDFADVGDFFLIAVRFPLVTLMVSLGQIILISFLFLPPFSAFGGGLTSLGIFGQSWPLRPAFTYL
jgi:hypothetical protein